MILVSTSIFAYDDLGVFQTDNNVGTPTEVKIVDSIVDELYIKTDTSTVFSTTKESWQPSTIIKAPFISDLHGGNINLNGLTITELRFKRKKIDELEWTKFVTVPYDSTKSFYEIVDRVCESFETYEYAVVPYGGGLEGDYKIKQVEVEFYNCYIFDKLNNYQLIYDLELSDIPYNIPSSTIETLGAKYPIVVYPSNLNYRSSSVKCKIVSDSTAILGGKIDGKQEKLLRNSIMAFLTNKKPKIIKDGSGNMLLISIIGSPKVIPYNELNQLIYDLSFDFVEIGTFDETTLTNAGLL